MDGDSSQHHAGTVSAREGFAVILYVLPASLREEERLGVGCREGAMDWGVGDEYNFLGGEGRGRACKAEATA